MNLWELFLKMKELGEEIDRNNLRKSRERNISERERLDKEIDRMYADYLELKHKLESINLDQAKK